MFDYWGASYPLSQYIFFCHRVEVGIALLELADEIRALNQKKP